MTDIDNTVFEHCWKYFELHAQQRTFLFRNYIIFFSIFVTGSSFLLTKCKLDLATTNKFIIGISIIFIIITIIFFKLDNRNKFLIDASKEAIKKIENDNFPSEYRIFSQISEKTNQDSFCLTTHTLCFRTLFILAIFSAAVLIIYADNRTCTCATCEVSPNLAQGQH